MSFGLSATAWTAIGSVGGALIGSHAAGKAADAQRDAADKATGLQRDIYESTVARNAPFVSGGTKAFNDLLVKLGLSGDSSTPGFGTYGKMPTAEDVMNEPGYQFGLQQGEKGIERMLAGKGLAFSGAAGKALARYGTDYATTKYGNAFDRLLRGEQQGYNQLAGLAGMGQASANNTASAGAQFGEGASTNLMRGADAESFNALQQGNLWRNVLNQGVSAYNNADGGKKTIPPVNPGGTPYYPYDEWYG